MILMSLTLGMKLVSYVHVIRNAYYLTNRIRKLGNKATNKYISENEASNEVYYILKIYDL